MAVVVQQQLNPDLGFVLHTRHPGEQGAGGTGAHSWGHAQSEEGPGQTGRGVVQAGGRRRRQRGFKCWAPAASGIHAFVSIDSSATAGVRAVDASVTRHQAPPASLPPLH